MPLRICVETESGAHLEETADMHNVLTRLAERDHAQGLALAHTVDPWGDTVFNGLQIPAFLADLETMAPAASEDERRVLEAVARLATRALLEPHLYLKIYGD